MTHSPRQHRSLFFFYLLFNQTPVAGEQIMEFSGGEGACTQPTWGLGILVQATHQEGERREEEEKIICTVSLEKQQGAWTNGVQNWGYSSLIIKSKIFREHPLPKASSASSDGCTPVFWSLAGPLMQVPLSRRRLGGNSMLQSVRTEMISRWCRWTFSGG